MEQGDQRDRYIRTGIHIIIGILFLFSVFVLAAERFDFSLESFLRKQETREILKVVAENSEWDYMDGGVEPGVGNVWTTSRYDNESWKKGAGSFSALDSVQAEVKLDSRTDDNRNTPTYFFRKRFTVDSLKSILSMEGEIRYSDAVVVYLNGEIIFAGNVPAGGYSSNQETGVAQDLGQIQESRFYVTDLSMLRRGENILAVEIHEKDGESSNAFLDFSYFNLLGIEIEEKEPDTASVILEQGRNAEVIGVNWMTTSPDYYEVEYLEASEYTDPEKEFSSLAQKRLMGRTWIKENRVYVNRVTLNYLKTGVRYLYRIKKVGGAEGSALMSFTTADKTHFSFAVLGDPQIGSYGADDYELWNEAVNSGFELIGNTDFILAAGDQVDGIGKTPDITKAFYTFRSPEIFKAIPMGIIKGNHEKDGVTAQLYDSQFKREGQSPQGDSYFTYQDTLIVMLNSNNMDFEAHEEFLRNAVRKEKRKWVMVLMHHSIFSSGSHREDEEVEAMREAYSEIFSRLNVDLVLSGHDHVYSRSYIMKGDVVSTSGGAGKTLYVTAGSSSGNKFYGETNQVYDDTAVLFDEPVACITRVDVGQNQVKINAYRIDTGELIDSCALNK